MSDTLPSDPAELRAMIAALTARNARMTVEVERMTATLRAQELLVQALQARIAKLQRQRFGPGSRTDRTRDRAARAGTRGSPGCSFGG